MMAARRTSISRERSRNASSREVTVSHVRQRVSFTSVPSKMSCTHVRGSLKLFQQNVVSSAGYMNTAAARMHCGNEPRGERMVSSDLLHLGVDLFSQLIEQKIHELVRILVLESSECLVFLLEHLDQLLGRVYPEPVAPKAASMAQRKARQPAVEGLSVAIRQRSQCTLLGQCWAVRALHARMARTAPVFEHSRAEPGL